MPIPPVISITTLPSRIGKIRPTLDSLLAGRVVPDKIFLPLPKLSRRENCAYEIPAFLKDKDYCRDIIEVIEVGSDSGPGTKVLGVLNRLSDPCYLIAADDDVRYKPGFLSGLLDAQRGDHAASFSYHTYRAGGLTIGQGCDGFSFHSPNLRGLDHFYQDHVAGTDLFYHDDLWLSFFLFTQGIAIMRPKLSKGDGLIYEIVYQTNSLNQLPGELTRKKLDRRGVKLLLQSTKLDPQKQNRLKATAIFDQLITSPARRIKRKATQVKRALGGWEINSG